MAKKEVNEIEEKKMGFGAVLTLTIAVLACLATALYCINSLVMKGYFYGNFSTEYLIFAGVSIGASLLAFLLSITKFKGNVANFIVGLLKVGIPVALLATALYIASSRLGGLSYIFFSDANVLSEIQTQENMISAYMSIATIAVFLVAWVLSLLNAWIGLKKVKVEDAE